VLKVTFCDELTMLLSFNYPPLLTSTVIRGNVAYVCVN